MPAQDPIVGTPGEIYERHMVPAIFAHWAPVLVDAAHVQSGHRALDVACGTGAVTRVLAERVGPTGRVVALDINPGMLTVGHAAVPSAHVEWREASAVQLPLPDATFDLAVCQQGVQFFPDKAAALAEMHRVIKPGGRLALACWRSIEHQPGFLQLQEALAKRIGATQAALPPFALGDGDALRALVVGAAFRDVKRRVEAKMVRFPSAEHMVRVVVGGAPSMLGALAAQGDGALEAIAAEVGAATRAYVDDDGWAIPLFSHIVTAGA